jgi:uncharacterized protein YjbI with pentapeptide repeats
VSSPARGVTVGTTVMVASSRRKLEQAIRAGRGLRGGMFPRLDLRHFVFPPGTDVSGANFNGSDLTGAILDRCIAHGALFGGAEMWRVSARGIEATHADFSRVEGVGVDFTDADLSDSRFDGSVLCHAIFRNACLRRTGFPRAWLLGATFEGAQTVGSLTAGALFA